MKRSVFHNQKCKNGLAFTSDFHAITTKGVRNEPTGHARNQLEHTHTHTQMNNAHTYCTYIRHMRNMTSLMSPKTSRVPHFTRPGHTNIKIKM
jgi:hypothetical protein